MAASGSACSQSRCADCDRMPAATRGRRIRADIPRLGRPARSAAAGGERAVALCQSAGIHVVMITGDHRATAHAIARRLGIASTGDAIVTGTELAAMSTRTSTARVARHRVYARVAPEDKIRIVEGAAASRRIRRDDRRRRERRAGAAPRGHRRRHGPQRHRRGARGVAHGAAGRQLRDDREGRARRPPHLRQHSAGSFGTCSRPIPARSGRCSSRRSRTAAPAAADSHPVDESRDRRIAWPRARRRAGGGRRHAPAAAAADARACSRTVSGSTPSGSGC